MQFLSLIVLALIAVSVGVNLLLPPRFRLYWILICNAGFVSLFSFHSLILALIIGYVNFIGAKNLRKRLVFPLLLGFNIGSLLLANYLISTGNTTGLSFLPVHFSIHPALVTLGLSFYTLQHIAYIIDCRNSRQVPENNVAHFIFAATFFPKYLSGPLTRYEEIDRQHGQMITRHALASGFNRLLLGVFKKMVIADRLAPSVHSVFDFNDHYPGLTVLAGALLFTVQLYFDFSGYTDMALGTAEMLGYRLPENFNMPFRSASVTEFWRRWHISLIRFFTDYVFFPLSYSFRKYRYLSASIGITLTFLLSGIWHGIGLTFLGWSICHLVYLQLELGLRKKNTGVVGRIGGWLYMLMAVSFSNVFFRSTDAYSLGRHLASLAKDFIPADLTSQLLAPLAVGGQQFNFFNFYTTLLLALLFLLFEKKLNTVSVQPKFSMVYTMIILMLIFLFGVFAGGEQFIYVQF